MKRMNLIARCRHFLGRLKLHQAQKLVVAVVGGSVVLVGIAMLVLPGPAILVIPLGLAILATEFLWARRWLKKARALIPNGNKKSAGFSWPSALLIPHRRYLLLLAALFGGNFEYLGNVVREWICFDRTRCCRDE